MKSFLQLVFASLVIGLVSVGSSYAQQNEQKEENIELVDQDGQKVDARKFKVIAQAGKAGGNAADIQSADGKIIIVDNDGKRREIDVSGAQNIIVNKSVQSIIKNGEEQQQVTGKAIIIGPDGERQEFNIGVGGNDLVVPDQGLRGVFDMMPRWRGFGNLGAGNFVFGSDGNVSKFMIGVNCNPVSDQLRAHMDLEEGMGLVVTSLGADDSPARIAGIKLHDVLTYADQDELASVKDLSSAVQLAGKEDRPITITILRSGKETSVEVKPIERKMIQAGGFEGFPSAHQFRFEKIGPGFVMGDEKNMGDLFKRFEALDAQIQRQMEDMKRIELKLLDRVPEGDDD